MGGPRDSLALVVVGREGQRPDFKQAGFGGQRPNAVGGHGTEKWQQEIVRKHELHCVEVALGGKRIEIGYRHAACAPLIGDLLVQTAVERHRRAADILRQVNVAQTPGDVHLAGVHHARHALAQSFHEKDSGINKCRRCRWRRWRRQAGVLPIHICLLAQIDIQLWMRLHRMVAFLKRFHGKLPVGG